MALLGRTGYVQQHMLLDSPISDDNPPFGQRPAAILQALFSRAFYPDPSRQNPYLSPASRAATIISGPTVDQPVPYVSPYLLILTSAMFYPKPTPWRPFLQVSGPYTPTGPNIDNPPVNNNDNYELLTSQWFYPNRAPWMPYLQPRSRAATIITGPTVDNPTPKYPASLAALNRAFYPPWKIQKMGPPPLPPVLVPPNFNLAVDWQNDGSFNQVIDDLSGRLRLIPPATSQLGTDMIRPLAQIMAGTFDCEVDNQDTLLSMENQASVYYPYLYPGHPMIWQVSNGNGYTAIWSGTLDDIKQNPNPLQKTVSLPGLGNLAKAQGKLVSTALYQNITTDVAIGYILDAIGFSSSNRILATGDTTLRWWWLNNEDALSALQTLVNSEGPSSRLYEDGSGNIVFENRHYRLNQARCITSQATFYDKTFEPMHSDPFAYDPGIKSVVNVCTVTQNQRTAKATAVVWSAGQTLTFGALETKTLVATGSDPFNSAIVPVAATDFVVAAGSITSVTLDRASGALVTITMIAGAGGATVTGMQLRANPVTIDGTTAITSTLNVATSQSKYQVRPYPLQVRSEIDINVLQDYCNAVVLTGKDPLPLLQITVKADISQPLSSRMVQSLTRQISDRVTVIETQTVAIRDCYIDRIGRSYDAGSNMLITTYGLTSVNPIGANYTFFRLDSSLLDGVDLLAF